MKTEKHIRKNPLFQYLLNLSGREVGWLPMVGCGWPEEEEDVYRKAELMARSDLERVTDTKLAQVLNAPIPIVTTESGTWMFRRPVHRRKALFWIVVTVSGMLTDRIKAQPLNAPAVMVVVPFGMSTWPVALGENRQTQPLG
jgi:hypothetical protein